MCVFYCFIEAHRDTGLLWGVLWRFYSGCVWIRWGIHSAASVFMLHGMRKTALMVKATQYLPSFYARIGLILEVFQRQFVCLADSATVAYTAIGSCIIHKALGPSCVNESRYNNKWKVFSDRLSSRATDSSPFSSEVWTKGCSLPAKSSAGLHKRYIWTCWKFVGRAVKMIRVVMMRMVCRWRMWKRWSPSAENAVHSAERRREGTAQQRRRHSQVCGVLLSTRQIWQSCAASCMQISHGVLSWSVNTQPVWLLSPCTMTDGSSKSARFSLQF